MSKFLTPDTVDYDVFDEWVDNEQKVRTSSGAEGILCGATDKGNWVVKVNGRDVLTSRIQLI